MGLKFMRVTVPVTALRRHALKLHLGSAHSGHAQKASRRSTAVTRGSSLAVVERECSALGADSDIIALSVAAGLIKSILVMIVTPMVAKTIGLNNPQSAMVFGGLMGTTSGVAAGLAATDPKLVPYGAMTATFYTGVGCLLGPSILFFIVNAIL